jgi:hypothetical protein
MTYEVTVNLLGVQYHATVQSTDGPQALIDHIEQFSEKTLQPVLEYQVEVTALGRVYS